MPVKISNLGIGDSRHERSRITRAPARRRGLVNGDRLAGDLGAAGGSNRHLASRDSGHNAVGVDRGDGLVGRAPGHCAGEIVSSVDGKLTDLEGVVAGDAPVTIDVHDGDAVLIGLVVDPSVLVLKARDGDGIVLGGGFLGLLSGLELDGGAGGDLIGRDGVGAVRVGGQFGLGTVDRELHGGEVKARVGRGGELEVLAGGNGDLGGRQGDVLAVIGDIGRTQVELHVGLGCNLLVGRGGVLSGRGVLLRGSISGGGIAGIGGLGYGGTLVCRGARVLRCGLRCRFDLALSSDDAGFFQPLGDCSRGHTRKQHRCRYHNGHRLDAKYLCATQDGTARALAILEILVRAHIYHLSNSPCPHTARANLLQTTPKDEHDSNTTISPSMQNLGGGDQLFWHVSGQFPPVWPEITSRPCGKP